MSLALSDYNKQLLAAFNATEEDLIQNRDGAASGRQRDLVKKNWDRLGKIGIVIAIIIGAIFLTWIYEISQQPISNVEIGNIFSCFVYIIPIFACALFSIAMFKRRDHSAQEPLTTTEGEAFIVQPSINKIYPSVFIGNEKDEDKRIVIYSAQSRLFHDQTTYKIYRIGTEIVAVEALEEQAQYSKKIALVIDKDSDQFLHSACVKVVARRRLCYKISMLTMRTTLICLSALFLLSCFSFYFFVYPKQADIEKQQAPSEASISYPSEWNFYQSKNSCGPYSAAAVIRIVTKQNISSETTAKTTPWRYRGYTLPFGIISDLEKYHVGAEERIVSLSDSEKLSWLRDKISKGTPIILLIRKNRLLHYVTLLGYKEKTFDVYDSLETKGPDGLTVDNNSSLPGNTTWTNDQLLSMWNQGGLFGLYRNYAIYPTLR